MSAAPPGPSGLVVGTAGMGGLYDDPGDAAVSTALADAWDLGLREYDTAPHYGLGTAERRLGAALQERPREEYRLQTKVGRLLIPDAAVTSDDEGFPEAGGFRRRFDYSADGVRRSLAESRERLGIDRIDVALVHDPEHHLDTALTEAAATLGALRDERLLAGWGVGTNFVEVAAAFFDRTDADHLLIAGRYSLLDRRAEQLLDRIAERAGVTVEIAGVLNSGLLVDGGGTGMFNYAPAPQPIIDAAAAMGRLCADHDVPLLAAALQFAGRHPAVSRVVIGATTRAEFAQTVTALTTPIPDELWEALEAQVPDQTLLPD